MVGKTLAHCRVFEKLGANGREVAWKVGDTQINRAIAIEVLPLEKLAGPSRLDGPTGYPSADWSPPESGSASPDASIML